MITSVMYLFSGFHGWRTEIADKVFDVFKQKTLLHECIESIGQSPLRDYRWMIVSSLRISR